MLSLAALTGVFVGSASPKPVFPLKWSAHEQGLISQGKVSRTTGGLSYFDGPSKKEAYIKDKGAAGAWDVIITDYSDPKWKQGKEYHIRIFNKGFKNHTLVRHCEEWCEPTTPEICDMFDSFCQPEYISKGKFITTENISFDDAVTLADKFEWPDGIGPIPINELTLWTKPSAALPYRTYRDILITKGTNITTDFLNFTAVTGDFDPSIFYLGDDVDSRPCQSPQPSDTCTSGHVFRGMKL